MSLAAGARLGPYEILGSLGAGGMGGHDQGVHYVVSELLEGMTLRERLGAEPLPVRKALDYAVQVARGLAAAHDRHVVHRDLKPENLFVTRDGLVKILDFGLAKRAQEAASASAPAGPATPATTIDLTEPGVVLGTVGYMSPEQVRGEATDARSDIFSFGAVLYEMLTGRRAFQGASASGSSRRATWPSRWRPSLRPRSPRCPR